MNYHHNQCNDSLSEIHIFSYLTIKKNAWFTIKWNCSKMHLVLGEDNFNKTWWINRTKNSNFVLTFGTFSLMCKELCPPWTGIKIENILIFCSTAHLPISSKSIDLCSVYESRLSPCKDGCSGILSGVTLMFWFASLQSPLKLTSAKWAGSRDLSVQPGLLQARGQSPASLQCHL